MPAIKVRWWLQLCTPGQGADGPHNTGVRNRRTIKQDFVNHKRIMEVPVKLHNKIIGFLKSLPNIGDTRGRRAFIYSAGLDSQLSDQIPFDDPPAQFIPLLVFRER